MMHFLKNLPPNDIEFPSGKLSGMIALRTFLHQVQTLKVKSYQLKSVQRKILNSVERYRKILLFTNLNQYCDMKMSKSLDYF